MSKILLPLEWRLTLQDIPETDMGYHYVHVYLKGPKPTKEVFRIQALILNESIIDWPDKLGPMTDYDITRIVEITKKNSHQTSD